MEAERSMANFQKELLLLKPFGTKTAADGNCDSDRARDPVEEALRAFTDGKFEEVLGLGCLSALVVKDGDAGHPEEVLRKRVEGFVEENRDGQLLALILGASSLQLFVRDNWTGPPSTALPTQLLPLLAQHDDDYVRGLLAVDAEPIHPGLLHPQYLSIAKVLLGSCRPLLEDCQTVHWWCLRYLVVHQQALDERCPSLFLGVTDAIGRAFRDSEGAIRDAGHDDLVVQLHLEAFHAYLFYYDHGNAKRHLEQARQLLGLDTKLTGVLGKRMLFQQEDTAQLTVQVQRRQTDSGVKRDDDDSLARDLPKSLLLNDEERLESIRYRDGQEVAVPELTTVEQAAILASFTEVQKTNAVHRLVDEELAAYLTVLLRNPRCWAVQTAALLHRSKMESSQSRSVERSMSQIQALVDNYELQKPPVHFRLHLFYGTMLPPRHKVEKEMANLFLRLGAINGALEVFLRLRMWEDVILCYHLLKRRDKAAALVRQQLAAGESPILWCYLGDATDDPECYQKAWELSGHHSARAQKSLGMMYFRKKEYDRAFPHLEKSLEINAIQLDTWFAFGYAAMQVENWEAAARSYRRCITLEPENFEAWNNLSNAYIKLDQKPRAWRTLQEALKCNFEDWRIWENYLLVSVDCGAFSDAIKAYHRILDLKDKYVDCELLAILVRATVDGIKDSEGNDSTRLRPQVLSLFGRLTSKVTNNGEVWRLYAKVTSAESDRTDEVRSKIVQYLQRAHRCASQAPDWERAPKTCRTVVDVSLELADAYVRMTVDVEPSTANQHLSSSKLMLNSTVSRIRQYWSSTLTETPEEVGQDIKRLEDKLAEINRRL